MVDPVTATAAIAAIGETLKGAGSYLGQRQLAKAEKKKAKESKRKTFADLLNESLARSYDASKDVRRSQSDLTGARAKALQDMAAGIRQSLVR